MNLIDTLNWRYAAKRMTSEKVSDTKVTEILEAINLTATSAGMQPFRVIVVSNPEIKAKLQAASFNPQVSESSHLLVFASYSHVSQAHVDEYISLVAKTRNVPLESLDPFKEKLSAFASMPEEFVKTWAAKQAYIALGTAIVAAANLKVDSTPMEGFDNAAFDEILGLSEKGLQSAVILALGYRNEELDPYAKAKKVRIPLDELTITLN
ncbi:NAD(P)H-dependent oxidoreductase [Fluviicola chungangensis]|uniref:NAD(P)H-dependent oxidoreductase n=1 Tax=Fluviicola chungangensis TaxID=2597671 RepID=A0A556N6I8_9FLAO|nr:NAD(P)H-dependent oxidoreductase [Fluviicola chungangensis]TSJ47777.1 NAD(P)H-dependent oxidoreductase [Fluviicola chungangensis]